MFIAISGLLLLGAMAGINGSISSTRFNDAVNSTTSFIQSQYGEVTNGRNSRLSDVGCNASGIQPSGNSVPGMTTCIIMGRLLEFNVGGTTITSRYIVGQDTTTASSGETAAVLAASAKAASAGTDETFSVPWSTKINKMTNSNASAKYIAIVRSPVSERVLFYSFDGGSGLQNLDSAVITNNNLNKPVTICLLDDGLIDGRVGYIRIGSGQGQDIIRSDLTSTTGTCE